MIHISNRRRSQTASRMLIGVLLMLFGIGGLLSAVLAQPLPPNHSAPQLQQAEVREEEVSFHNGPIALAATLITPLGPGPHPAIIFVHGSSPNLRSAFRNYVTRLYVQQGLAALIYDKRGAGQSTGTTATASLSDLADDAVAGVRYLQQRPDIIPQAIGLVGDSQAGYVIPLAVSRAPEVAFMALVSASAVSIAQQEAYSIEQRLLAAGRSTSLAGAGRNLRRLLDAYSNAVAAGELPAPDGFRQSSLVRLGTYYDPAAALRQLTIPTLIILGEADSRVPTAYSAYLFDAIFKANGNPDYTIVVYPGADHGIQMAATSEAGEPIRVFAAGYQDLLASWVGAHGRGEPAAGRGLQGQARDDSAAFSSAGIYGALPWYGTIQAQLGALVLLLLGFLLPVGQVAGQILRRHRPQRATALSKRLAPGLALGAGMLNLAVLIGFGIVVAEILLDGAVTLVPGLPSGLPLLAVAAGVCALGLGGCIIAGSRTQRPPIGYLTIVAASVLLVPFLSYWQVWGWR